jgi:hypothetical protein
VASWEFAAGGTPPGGGPSVDLGNAMSKTVTVRLGPDQNHEASFVLNGADPQAAAFTELQNDLWCFRAGWPVPVFQGRIAPTTDQLDTAHKVQVTAMDYREVLARRRLFASDTLAFTSVDQSLIALSMINATQGRAGGSLGIVAGAGAHTGIPRTLTFQAGDFVAADIIAMAQMDAGFDWDISSYGVQDLRLDIWSPFRGASRGVVLEYGSSLVASITRTVDPSAFADALLVTGDPSAGLTAQQPEAADIATRPEGRWDQVAGTTQLTSGGLASRAAYELASAEVVIPSYTVVLAANAWGGPGHIWLGDEVTVRIRSGRLAVNDLLRVVEVGIAIGDDDDERVTLQVGAIPFRIGRSISASLRRLRNLESR